MNAKPILVIRFPLGAASISKIKNEISRLSEQMKDYHLLFLVDNSIERIEFECINALNAKDEDIEVLKRKVLSQIEEIGKD